MKKHPDWREEILDLYHVHASIDVISAVPGFLHQGIIELNTHLFLALRQHLVQAARSQTRNEASLTIEKQFKVYVQNEIEPLRQKASELNLFHSDCDRTFEAYRMLRLFRFYDTDHTQQERLAFIQQYDQAFQKVFHNAPMAASRYIEMTNRYRNGFELWYLPALTTNMATISGGMAKGHIQDSEKMQSVFEDLIRLIYYSLLIRDQNTEVTAGIYKSVNFAAINAPLQTKSMDYDTFSSHLKSLEVLDDLLPEPDRTIPIGTIHFASEQNGIIYAPQIAP